MIGEFILQFLLYAEIGIVLYIALFNLYLTFRIWRTRPEVERLILATPHQDIYKELVKLEIVYTSQINAPGGVTEGRLYINPIYWKYLTLTEKFFVLYHEAMHVMLGHVKYYGEYELNLNTALDLVVNQKLVNEYGFLQKDVNRFRFIDNTFKFPKLVELNAPPEYYLYLIRMQESIYGKM